MKNPFKFKRDAPDIPEDGMVLRYCCECGVEVYFPYDVVAKAESLSDVNKAYCDKCSEAIMKKHGMWEENG